MPILKATMLFAMTREKDDRSEERRREQPTLMIRLQPGLKRFCSLVLVGSPTYFVDAEMVR